jgi:hypothetical protein
VQYGDLEALVCGDVGELVALWDDLGEMGFCFGVLDDTDTDGVAHSDLPILGVW